MTELRPIVLIARRELAETVRSRWVTLAGGLFGVLAIAMALFGTASVGAAGVGGFGRTAVALLNLVLYLVPLLALLLSVGSMATDGEQGSLELLLAQPVSRAAVVLGKFGGLGAALAAALFGGLGAAGVAIGVAGGTADVAGYLLLLARALALGLAFISMGLWIAGAAASRLRALAWALLVWFVTVLLYDLLVVGATAILGGSALRAALGGLLVANPVDLVRVATLVHLGGADSFGLTAQALIGFLRGPAGALALAGALAAWIVLPLVGAVYALRRRDIGA